MDNQLVSVLMVNYNHADTIGETIKSVLDQTYQNIQLIIVDDGSTDQSCEVIEAFDDQRIELYRLEKNRHICHATNYGFEKVTGTYLARIDSDDVWYPHKLEKQMAYLAANKDRHICFSWIDLIDENGNSINEECKELVKLFETNFTGQADCLHTFFFIGNCISHPSVLMRTDVMHQIGGFDLGYMQAHDFDYWVRIAKQYPIYVMPERLLAMRRFMGAGKENTNNSNDSVVSGIRFFNEFMDIRAHFFENLDNQVFCDTFRGDFRCHDSQTEQELAIEKAFLLCKPIHGRDSVPAAGILQLNELLRNPNSATLLEEKYNFTAKDFYNLTGKPVYYDDMCKRELAEKTEECKNLYTEIQQLKAQNVRQRHVIAEYAESTSWKVTAPLRVVGKWLRK